MNKFLIRIYGTDLQITISFDVVKIVHVEKVNLLDNDPNLEPDCVKVKIYTQLSKEYFLGYAELTRFNHINAWCEDEEYRTNVNTSTDFLGLFSEHNMFSRLFAENHYKKEGN